MCRRALRVALVLAAMTFVPFVGAGVASADSVPPAIAQYVETIPSSGGSHHPTQGSGPGGSSALPSSAGTTSGGTTGHTVLYVVLLAVLIPGLVAGAFVFARRLPRST
jgi:hypothetical protein